MRLAAGDFTRAGEGIMNCQYLFLCAVVEHVLQAMHDLFALNVDLSGLGEVPYAEAAPRWRGEIPSALRDWARRYHLDVPWCLDFAIDSLRANEPTYRAYFVESAIAFGPDLHLSPVPTLDFALEAHQLHRAGPLRGWYPTRETRGEARERILGAFTGDLDTYLSAVEQQAVARGLVPAPRKQARGNRRRVDPLLHFEWLARYQCGGKFYDEIAESVIAASPTAHLATGRLTATVRQAVKRTARRIELPLRPGRRQGRVADIKETAPRGVRSRRG